MFDQSAEFYDAFYDALGKDYAAEARAIATLIEQQRAGASTLLDVACGTGRHLEFLSTSMQCVGVDIEPGLLAVAEDRCPTVTFAVADMRTLDLGRTFDVVTCLFSSIGYMPTVEGLRQSIRSMSNHLHPGGLLIIEPWFHPETWTAGRTQVLDAQLPDGRRAVRMMTSKTEVSASVLDTHYLVSDGTSIAHTSERHVLGLFSRDTYTDALTAAGLSVQWDTFGLTGRGLAIGTAPAR